METVTTPDRDEPRAASRRAHKVLLRATDVARRYQLSERQLARWCRDKDMNFPKPTVLARRRFWDADVLDEFDREHVTK
jgi:predicted DNA-binding transcriptional regulator AlpA